MASARVDNKLINSLPAAERRSFTGDLVESVVIPHERVSAAGKRLQAVHFPVGCVVSALYRSSGALMEVYGVGREGMLGCDALLQAEYTRYDLVCQIGGRMLSMSSARFEIHVRRSAQLRRAVALHLMSSLAFRAQSVGCNGMHSIAQRCARWLLISQDRVGRDEFDLTHAIVARLLGTYRPGVSVALARLQRLGIIRYAAGRVTIGDRPRLIGQSCECYALVLRESDRIRRSPRSAT